MAYRLAISDKVGVKVEGSTVDEDGVEKRFRFVLVCDRLPQDRLRDLIADKSATSMDFFRDHAHGWRDQRLVLDADGNPAPFSLEALQCLFTISGLSAVCWQAYLSQVVATAKN